MILGESDDSTVLLMLSFIIINIVGIMYVGKISLGSILNCKFIFYR